MRQRFLFQKLILASYVCALSLLCAAEDDGSGVGVWSYTYDEVKNAWTKTCVATEGAGNCCKIGETKQAASGTDVNCAWITIGIGPVKPGTTLSAGRFQIRAETPTPQLATPQGLEFVMGYGIASVSHERTASGAPRDLFFLDSAGVTLGIRFDDDEAVGSPFLGNQLDRSERVIMVDAEGWAVTNDPAYYDLYPGDGSLWRFGASTNSEDFLNFVLYRSSQGREETSGAGGMEVIRDENRVLRQVLAPTRLADIVVSNSCEYSIVFYQLSDVLAKGTNGLYGVDTDAIPMKVWTIESPGCSVGLLRVSEITGGATNISDYVYKSGINEWELTKGSGLQRKARDIVWDGNQENMWSTYTIRAADGSIAYKTTDKYHNFSWGLSLVESVQDPDTLALTTTQSYYDDPAITSSYGYVKTTERPDGSWTTFGYGADGKKNSRVDAWKDSAVGSDPDNARATYYDYAPVDSRDTGVFNDRRPRTVTEKVLGITVAKTYHVYGTNVAGEYFEIEEKCLDPDAFYGDPSNLCSVETYYSAAAGAHLVGRLKSIQQPDGQLDTYLYEYGNYIADADPAACHFQPDFGGAAFRTTVIHGTTNNPDGIVNKTTKDTTIVDPANNEVLTETYVFTGSTDYERIGWVMQEFDFFGNVTDVYRSNGEHEEASWGSGCCGKDNETDAYGTQRTFSYDALGRLGLEIKRSVDNNPTNDLWHITEYDAANRVMSEMQCAWTVWPGPTTSNAYDGVGRLVGTIDPAGLITTHTYADGGRTETVVKPGGATEVTDQYLDGRTRSVTGTSVVPQYYDYGVNADGSQWTIVYTGSTNSPMWEKTTVDCLGRTIRVEKPGFGGVVVTNASVYNSKSQLIQISNFQFPISTIYQYDDLGNIIRSGQDMNRNGVLDLATMDRITESETGYVKESDEWWQVTVSRLYAVDNSAMVKTTGVQKIRLTGLAASQSSETVSLDMLGNETIQAISIDRGNKTVTRTILYPDSTNAAEELTVNGLLTSSMSKTGVRIGYVYDDLERQVGLIDPRTGTNVTHYNSKGQIDYVQDASGAQTGYAYDPDTGLKTAEYDALSNSTYFAYNSLGQVIRNWGSAVYPVAYAYDGYGRLEEMRTWRTGANWHESSWPTDNGPGDPTRWCYDEATGLLTNKLYADGKGPTYTYTVGGNLARRTWARGITTDYGYDLLGQLTDIDYSDATPDVSFTYDRLGRQVAVTDVLGASTNLYDPATLAVSEEQRPDGTALHRSYDPFGRPSGISLGADYSVNYSYDAVGRFSSISSAVSGSSAAWTYSYLPDSDLIRQLTNNYGQLTAYTYDPQRNLKTQVLNKFGTNLISQFGYFHDALGRRVNRIDLPGVTTNDFGYNTRSELTDAVMGTNLYAYQYDPIGNREWAEGNADTNRYTVNELNQYLSVSSALSAVSLSYDPDGNLTNDGVFSYTWDAENRLIQVSGSTTLVVNTYDFMSRRMVKASASTTNAFIYDGWNLVAEYSYTPTPLYSHTNLYIWGFDLSQSLQGAGGVGGLLACINHQPLIINCFFHDANGNVTELLSTNGSIAAHYEYDPYGNILIASGSAASANPYRFSTKFTDQGTGLLYYGYRFYSPELGRWVSRDPIEEQGGKSVYGLSHNSPVLSVDYLGLLTIGQRVTARFALRVARASMGPLGIAMNAVTKGPVHMSDDAREMDAGVSPKVRELILDFLRARDPGTTAVLPVSVPNLKRYSGDIIFAKGDENFGTGWWLNGAHAVSADGTITDVCRNPNGWYSYGQASLVLVWKDAIDANATDGDNRYKKALESVWGKYVEPFYHTDWRIEIKWKHAAESSGSGVRR